VEQTLLEGGRGQAVIQHRMEFQELMRERFEAAAPHRYGSVNGRCGRAAVGVSFAVEGIM
jgi:hypothetical protein